MIDLFKIGASINLDDNGASAKLNSVGQSAQGASGGLSTMSVAVGNLAGNLASQLLTKLPELIDYINDANDAGAEFGDAMGKGATRLGMTTEEFTALSKAADFAAINMTVFTRGASKFDEALAAVGTNVKDTSEWQDAQDDLISSQKDLEKAEKDVAEGSSALKDKQDAITKAENDQIDATNAITDAKKDKAKALREEEAAEQAVLDKQNELQAAMGEYQSSTNDVAVAQENLTAVQNGEYEMSDNVKSAYDKIGDSKKSVADANIALRNSELSLKEAQQSAQETLRKYGEESNAYRDALQNVEKAKNSEEQAKNKVSDAESGVEKAKQNAADAEAADRKKQLEEAEKSLADAQTKQTTASRNLRTAERNLTAEQDKQKTAQDAVDKATRAVAKAKRDEKEATDAVKKANRDYSDQKDADLDNLTQKEEAYRDAIKARKAVETDFSESTKGLEVLKKLGVSLKNEDGTTKTSGQLQLDFLEATRKLYASGKIEEANGYLQDIYGARGYADLKNYMEAPEFETIPELQKQSLMDEETAKKTALYNDIEAQRQAVEDETNAMVSAGQIHRATAMYLQYDAWNAANLQKKVNGLATDATWGAGIGSDAMNRGYYTDVNTGREVQVSPSGVYIDGKKVSSKVKGAADIIAKAVK